MGSWLVEALEVRGASVKIDKRSDTTVLIRTYPMGVISIRGMHDSTYTLPSGDKLTVVWKGTVNGVARGTVIAEIVPDTIRIPK